MAGTDEHTYNGMRVVSGSYFDGTPCRIALENVTVGQGSSARIRKGHLLGDDPFVVAVKVFGELLDDAKQQLLVRELHFAREVSMSHPSIVAFVGTATLGEQTAIVSLYMKNGNLMQYFKAHPKCNKKTLIVQVAGAVEFLHVEKKLVHGDLKCENVLVSDYGDALLADFGLSSFVEKSEGLSTTMTAIRSMHTLQFAAPELLGLVGDSNTPISKKTTQSDIYAFGMLVLEAISEQAPWGERNNYAVISSVAARQHPPRPTQDGTFVTMSHSWWDVCRSCWSFESHERPQISDLLCTLKATESAPYRDLNVRKRIRCAAYMPDGRTIVATSSDSVMLIDSTSGHIREHWTDGPWSDEDGFLLLAVSPDGLHIACGYDETIGVLASASGALMTSLQHDGIVNCAAYSPDGTRIASGAGEYPQNGTVRLWDTATGGACGQDLLGHTSGISCVSFSPDGSCLASGEEHGIIRLWDSRTCTLMATLEQPGCLSLYTVRFLPDGMRIAAIYYDGVVLFRDVRASATVQYIRQHSTITFADNISPSGRYIATVLGDIQIWDVQNECHVGGPLICSDDLGVTIIEFSPDERSIAIAGLHRLRVYDLFD